MNEAAIVLMLVTANGIQSGPGFQTYQECEMVSANIKTVETFCYHQEPVDIDGAIAQLGDMMNKMKQQLNETKK
jgi:hypothetical protein